LKVTGRRHSLAPPAATRDISSSGMFIKTRSPLEVGTRFVLNVAMPASEVPIEVSAEVVRIVQSGDAGMGVRFIYSGDAQKALLEAQVARLLPRTRA
jgi:type IV pilus assembly protein PilZ